MRIATFRKQAGLGNKASALAIDMNAAAFQDEIFDVIAVNI